MKRVYLSLFLHGNMCYDRYTKQVIRDCFPGIYCHGNPRHASLPPGDRAHRLSGLTTLSLKHGAPWFLEELKPLIERGQVVMADVSTQPATPCACSTKRERPRGNPRGMAIICATRSIRGASSFFPQEWPFHPQSPYLVTQAGARRTFVMNDAWERPRRVTGLNGNEVLIYARDRRMRLANLENTLEAYYDSHPDGAFLLAGGDFEDLGNVGRIVAKMEELAARARSSSG